MSAFPPIKFGREKSLGFSSPWRYIDVKDAEGGGPAENEEDGKDFKIIFGFPQWGLLDFAGFRSTSLLCAGQPLTTGNQAPPDIANLDVLLESLLPIQMLCYAAKWNTTSGLFSICHDTHIHSK